MKKDFNNVLKHIEDEISFIFSNIDLHKPINLPNSTTKIVQNQFEGYPFKEIVLPNDIETIEKEAFKECSLLTEITTPLIESIGSYSFKGASFTTLTFANLLEMGTNGHCFESCTKLEIINLNKIEELPPYSFNGCTSLHTIIGENVTTIKEYCF